MSLLVVLHVCAKDEHLALLALRASAHLDGQLKASVLVSYPVGFTPDAIVEHAFKAFAVVYTFAYSPWAGDDTWPSPANHAWASTARHIDSNTQLRSHTGWFWWEADATPIRKGWWATLDAAHKAKPRTLFAGHKCAASDGSPYMNGVGIWPIQCIEPLSNCAALYAQRVPFDIAAGRSIVHSFKTLNHLMVHEMKRFGGGAGRSFDQGRLRDLLTTHRQAVFYHGCTDGSLHALIAGEEPPPVQVEQPRPPANLPTLATVQRHAGRNLFYHSGDLGDIIYSLPTVRELGGGDLVMGPDNRTNMSTREKLTIKRASLIGPLLEVQPYVHGTSHSDLMPKDVTHDLNQMRQLLRSHRLDMQPGMNLARCYLQAFGLALTNDTDKWLHVPEPLAKAPVVLARSPRYRDATFRWDRVLATYRGQCIFVGTPDEHADFEREWGPVPYERTDDLLALAQLIAGCRLFVGNQSLPYAIAEGLKRPAILEACPAGSNTLFARRDVTVGVTEDTLLPDVAEGRLARRKLTNSLTIAGPVDWFTGLGRATCQLAEHLCKVNSVHLMPTGINRRIPLPTTVEKLLPIAKPGDRPRLLISPLLDLPKRIQPGDTVLTMWESTRLPQQAVAALNQHAAQVIVPSTWCATTFSACGVNASIVVVPLGVDTKVYKPLTGREDAKSPRTTVFGAAGRLAHGGKRKGIEDVIAAFQLAFPNDDDPVQLCLKLFDDCYVPDFDDHRIMVIDKTLTDEDMAILYNTWDCFVSLAKGEGWGLHVQEALACGVSVIAPFYSGLADILPPQFPQLPVSIVPATEGYQGHWCQPSIEATAQRMRDTNFAWKTPWPVVTVEQFAQGVMEALQ